MDLMHPPELFLSMESEFNFPEILRVKEAGFDIAADYRLWKDRYPHADVGTPYLYFPPIPEGRWDIREAPVLPKRSDVLIAAFIGNCDAKNNRSRYLQELMEHMEVHSYGGCLHNIDQPSIQVPFIPNLSQSLRKIHIAKSYHYVFCPENSNVESYVTEKVYDVLRAGSVPVYFGAADINRFIPDPSAIVDANKFQSPADLARYLKMKSQREGYQSFFEWKKRPFSSDFNNLLQSASMTFECKVARYLSEMCF